MDVSNAFLHGHLEEQIFCQQPTGFVDSALPDHLGFRSTRSDQTLFVYHQGSDTAYLLLYVDDIILTTCSLKAAFVLNANDVHIKLTDRLRAEFAIKDLGPLHYFLGVEVVRRSDGFFLHQRKYAHELVDRAGMLNCKPAATPVDTKAKLSASDGSPASDATIYQSIVGALQYLTLTRPEIQYVVQQVCLHMHAPRDVYWAVVKRILCYVCATMELNITLYASADTALTTDTSPTFRCCCNSS
nr:uncharacterized mitochondrial protein AtMg00810-like [Aegilops tauschii subsp. strangulata]